MFSLSDDFIDEQEQPTADDEEDDNNKQQQSTTGEEEQQQPTVDRGDVPCVQQQANAEVNVEVFSDQQQTTAAEGDATGAQQLPTAAEIDVSNKQPTQNLAQARQEGPRSPPSYQCSNKSMFEWILPFFLTKSNISSINLFCFCVISFKP